MDGHKTSGQALKRFPQWGQLTRVGADGDGKDPEEKGECQRGTQQDHVSHHLHVLLHQHISLRVHDSELQDEAHVTYISVHHHSHHTSV